MSFDVAVLQPQTNRLFGFHDALAGAIYPPAASIYAQYDLDSSTLLLNDRGCLDATSQRHDCTKACQDPAAVWRDENAMFTMQNCMVYPVISIMLLDGNLSANALDTIEEYNILSASSIDLDRIVSPIQDCIDQFCKDGNNCGLNQSGTEGAYEESLQTACEIFSETTYSTDGAFSKFDRKPAPACSFLQQVRQSHNPWCLPCGRA